MKITQMRDAKRLLDAEVADDLERRLTAPKAKALGIPNSTRTTYV